MKGVDAAVKTAARAGMMIDRGDWARARDRYVVAAAQADGGVGVGRSPLARLLLLAAGNCEARRRAGLVGAA